MKFWRYHGPDKRVVLDDPIDGTVTNIGDVMQRVVGMVPKKLGPASVEFHVVESPKAYPTEEIGISMERLAGVLLADILVEKDMGEGVADRLADFICTTIRNTVSEGIRFGDSSIGEGHEFLDEKWRVQVSCPWHVDILSARN